MKTRHLAWLLVCALGVALARADGAESDWVAQVRAQVGVLPSRPRRVMLVFPLVEAGSEDGTIGWGRGLIALQAMWVSSFAPDRLLDTWDFTVHWRFAEQQLLGAGRRVTPEKIETVCAVADAASYVTGTLAVDDAGYTARLTLQGENGTRQIEHVGAKSELHRLPCLIAQDVVAYMRVPISGAQQQHMREPPLSSVELFDKVAGRFHACYYFGAGQAGFWKSVVDRCRTPWTEWEYLFSCYQADPSTVMARWQELAPEREGVALGFLRGQIAFGRGRYDEAGRALAPLLGVDPYVPHVTRWLARCAGSEGETELADALVNRLTELYGDSLLGPLHHGLCLMNYAWDARGGGWASTVTPDGWRLFHSRLQEAQTDLEKVLADEPRCWVAAANLIGVAKGLGLGDAYAEQRLAEATAACPTGVTAYSEMLNYLLPRWHGTREELLAFGRRCAAPELYQTSIPGLLIEAHADAATHRAAVDESGSTVWEGQIEMLFTQPAVWQEVKPVLERLATENPYDYRDLSRYLAFAYWNDDHELTARLFAQLPDDAWEDGWQSLAFWHLSNGLHAEIGRWVKSGFPALAAAVKADDAETVRKLIAEGEAVDQTMYDGWTPLHVAACHGRSGMARALLNGGADANVAADDGSTPMHVAAMRGNTSVALVLLAGGADVNARGPHGRTPLIAALDERQDTLARLLLKAHADPNATDADGRPAMYAAMWRWDEEMVRALAAAGADVNGLVQGQYPMLFKSCMWSDVSMARLLLELGADPNMKTTAGYPPICSAAYYGCFDGVRVLMEHGADLAARTPDGYTALHGAAMRGHVEVLKLLLAHGAKVDDSTPGTGWTALQLAAQNAHLDCVKALLEAGADINARKEHRSQAVHLAAQNGHVEMVRFLLDHGAEVNSDSTSGTPLHMAAKCGSKELVEMLLERGADVNPVNPDGQTPTSVAVHEGHTEIARLLREHGGIE